MEELTPDLQKQEKVRVPARASFYATFFPHLQETARDMGYALTMHGSLQRDLDLIAVPWIEEAAAPDTLAEALRDRCGGFFSRLDANGVPDSKPHGRLCWVIHLGSGPYIDLSVTPRVGWSDDAFERFKKLNHPNRNGYNEA